MAIHGPSLKLWDADVRAASEELDARFPRGDWTSTYPGHDPSAALAVDFMCSRAMGDKIADYVWTHRKRLGVRYVIWYGRIISETSSTPNRWVHYYAADDPNPSKSHKNHVHVSFYPNAKYTPLEKPITMFTNEDAVKGYSIDGDVKFTQKKGTELVGYPRTSSSGKYLVTSSDTWYPWERLSTTKPAADAVPAKPVVTTPVPAKPAAPKPTAPKPAAPKFLGPYVVDPLKVVTTLAIVNHKTGKVVGDLKPGDRIARGTKIQTVNGKSWLMGDNGNRYALSYLVLEKEFLSRDDGDDEGKA